MDSIHGGEAAAQSVSDSEAYDVAHRHLHGLGQ